MDYTMTRTGLNSVEFKTAKGVSVKINFSVKDNNIKNNRKSEINGHIQSVQVST